MSSSLKDHKYLLATAAAAASIYIYYRLSQRTENETGENEKVLKIFDFDGTLFASPVPSSRLYTQQLYGSILETPYNVKGLPGAGWYQDTLSLSTPYVPQIPPKEMFNQALVEEIKRCQEDPNSIPVLLTGRTTKYEERIKEIVASQGLEFLEMGFKPVPQDEGRNIVGNRNKPVSTIDFKLEFIKQLMNKYQTTRIEIYEDRPRHVDLFNNFIDLNNRLVDSSKRDNAHSNSWRAWFRSKAKAVLTTNSNSVSPLTTLDNTNSTKINLIGKHIYGTVHLCEAITTTLSEEMELELVGKLVAKNIPNHRITTQVSYTGVKLDEQSKDALLRYFLPVPKVLQSIGSRKIHPELSDWSLKCHHMTMKMGAIDWEEEKPEQQDESKEEQKEGTRTPLSSPRSRVIKRSNEFNVTLGQEVELRVVAVGISDKAYAVEVEGVKSANALPHVTLAVSATGKAKDSNLIHDWVSVRDTELAITLRGRIEEFAVFGLDSNQKQELARAQQNRSKTQKTVALLLKKHYPTLSKKPFSDVMKQTIFWVERTNESRKKDPQQPLTEEEIEQFVLKLDLSAFIETNNNSQNNYTPTTTNGIHIIDELTDEGKDQ